MAIYSKPYLKATQGAIVTDEVSFSQIIGAILEHAQRLSVDIYLRFADRAVVTINRSETLERVFRGVVYHLDTTKGVVAITPKREWGDQCRGKIDDIVALSMPGNLGEKIFDLLSPIMRAALRDLTKILEKESTLTSNETEEAGDTLT